MKKSLVFIHLNPAWEFYVCFSVVSRELGGFPRRTQLISKSWLNPGLCLPWSGVWVPLEIPEAALPSARGWGRRWQRRRWVKSRSFLNYRGSGNEEQESEGLECLEGLAWTCSLLVYKTFQFQRSPELGAPGRSSIPLLKSFCKANPHASSARPTCKLS